jgi:hypothetical protein
VISTNKKRKKIRRTTGLDQLFFSLEIKNKNKNKKAKGIIIMIITCMQNDLHLQRDLNLKGPHSNVHPQQQKYLFIKNNKNKLVYRASSSAPLFFNIKGPQKSVPPQEHGLWGNQPTPLY